MCVLFLLTKRNIIYIEYFRSLVYAIQTVVVYRFDNNVLIKRLQMIKRLQSKNDTHCDTNCLAYFRIISKEMG